jgi:hypothetical protein
MFEVGPGHPWMLVSVVAVLGVVTILAHSGGDDHHALCDGSDARVGRRRETATGGLPYGMPIEVQCLLFLVAL